MVSRIYENKLSHKKIFYKIGFVDAKDVAMDKEKYSMKCKDGCGVYGECWACPPYSPSFSDIKANLRRMLVLVSYKYNKRASKRPYDTVFKSHNSMAPKMHKIGMVLEKKLDGFLLKSGPCRVCRKCAALRKKPCKFPEKKKICTRVCGCKCRKAGYYAKSQSIVV